MPLSPSSLDTTSAVRGVVRRLAALLAPPVQMTTTDWARERRRLSVKSSARPGKYNPDLTPWVRGMHEALDDPTVTKVVAMKSAQVAWTDGVLLNYIGKRIDVDPCPMIVMFAKLFMGALAQSFNLQVAFLFPIAMFYIAGIVAGFVAKHSKRQASEDATAYPPTGPIASIND